MKILLRFVGNLLLLLLAAVIAVVFNFIFHEFGHCITIDQVGGKCEGVYAPPGVKIWPPSGIGDPYLGEWDNAMGMTVYEEAAPTQAARGFVSLMGSGSSALVSFVALLALWILEPRGWWRTLLMIQALFFGDLLFYTILPEWFGLRHFFFIGGSTAEPLEGAVNMGIERGDFITGVLAYSGVMFVAWLGYAWMSWRKGRRAG